MMTSGGKTGSQGDNPTGKAPFVGVRKGDKKKYKKFGTGSTYSKAAIEIANQMKDKRQSLADANVFTG